MAPEFRISTKGLTPDIAKRWLPRVLKAAWADVGVYWWTHYREKHFTKAGAREYGYALRQGERGRDDGRPFRQTYTGRKLEDYGHSRPLERTGESRRLVAIRDVRAKPKGKGVRIVIHARTFNRPHTHGRINMREEMTTISPREGDRLIEVLSDRITYHAEQVREEQRRRRAAAAA